jgi:hypothetical protein
MTEGIVQKVSNKYIKLVNTEESERFGFDASEVVDYIQSMRQELIEEIKKRKTRFGLLTSISVKELIGDMNK